MKAKVTVNELDGQAKVIGLLIAEALRHAGLTQQEASFRMGYADASKVARWVSGADVSSFLSRFLSVPELRRGFVIALAELRGDDVTVETVVTIGHPGKEAAS
jgi:hypothetical protein